MFINQDATRRRLSDSDPIFFCALMAFDPLFSVGGGAGLPRRVPAPFPDLENPSEAANAPRDSHLISKTRRVPVAKSRFDVRHDAL